MDFFVEFPFLKCESTQIFFNTSKYLIFYFEIASKGNNMYNLDKQKNVNAQLLSRFLNLYNKQCFILIFRDILFR